MSLKFLITPIAGHMEKSYIYAQTPYRRKNPLFEGHAPYLTTRFSQNNVREWGNVQEYDFNLLTHARFQEI